MPNPSRAARFSLRLMLALAVLTLCAALSSCRSSEQNLNLAKQSVVQFHSQLDAEMYQAIYAAADEKFHQATTQEDMTKFLSAVHRKLGTVQDAHVTNTGVAWFAGQGATVTLIYSTKFSDGSGTERFVWHIKDNVATLYNYNIQSNELVTK
jgi:hypothetical protein